MKMKKRKDDQNHKWIRFKTENTIKITKGEEKKKKMTIKIISEGLKIERTIRITNGYDGKHEA
jgi:hypothetical protein